MESFEYDIAISFAGGQRSEAEAITKGLRAANIKVFYDEYEQADLWGKDLYEHLADIYQRKARYCLMLASAAYAAKVWTTHERKNAQARALAQKGEYILPVRFDDTEIPGLPSTIGYFRFRDHGAEGIVALLLKKLGKTVPPNLSARTVTSSPRVCLLDQEQNLEACIPVVECNWGATEATLICLPDDSTDGPFLDGIRGARHPLFVAFKNNIGQCSVDEVEHIHKHGLDQWRLRFQIKNADFSPTMEMGMGSMSADDFAEQRARRILLDERAASDAKVRSVDAINDTVKELFVRGMHAPMQPTGSPFPEIYSRYGTQPTKFLEIAWINAILILKTSGVVVEVSALELTISGTELTVQFSGKRRKQYTNKPATVIQVRGACNLAKT